MTALVTVSLAVLGGVSAVFGTVAAWLQIQDTKHHFGRGQKKLAKRAPSRTHKRVWSTVNQRTRTEPFVGKTPITVGPLTIAVSMPIGSLTTAWDSAAVTSSYDFRLHPAFPDSVKSMYDGNLKRRLAEAQRNSAIVFNGPTYSLRGYHLAVNNPITESTDLQLLLGPTCFYDYLATNLSAAHQDIPKDVLESMSTLDIERLGLSNQLAVNSFECIPLTPESVSKSLVTDAWAPVATLTSLATIVQHAGREEVQAALRRFGEVRID
jgi:hypothetical protein